MKKVSKKKTGAEPQYTDTEIAAKLLKHKPENLTQFSQKCLKVIPGGAQHARYKKVAREAIRTLKQYV